MWSVERRTCVVLGRSPSATPSDWGDDNPLSTVDSSWSIRHWNVDHTTAGRPVEELQAS
jgi:hypothetical protein